MFDISKGWIKDFEAYLRTKYTDNSIRKFFDCLKALRITDRNEKCFLSHKKMVYSTQRINVLFKGINAKYHLKVEHFSTHTMRKTFGRKVFESAGENANMALMRLSELFNHSSPRITKIYLGIREKELVETFDLLDF